MTARPRRYIPKRIIEQTDRGIFVKRFKWPEADEITGRFGLNFRCGYIIRNGEVVDMVNNTLLMDNMFEVVRNIEMIGNDPRQMGVVIVTTMSSSGVELVGNRTFRNPLLHVIHRRGLYNFSLSQIQNGATVSVFACRQSPSDWNSFRPYARSLSPDMVRRAYRYCR